MYKSFQFRLYPTKRQIHELNIILNSCRYIYNKTLNLCKDTYKETGEHLFLYDTSAFLTLWKKDQSFLFQIYDDVLRDALKRVDKTYKNFFNRLKLNENPGFPRFKGINKYNSFTYQKGFYINNNTIDLPKMGCIKIRKHRQIEGKIKILTIKKTSTNKWYAIFTSDIKDQKTNISNLTSVGIDLGLTTFATLSDGNIILRKRFFKQYEKRIANASRKREKFKKGSKQRNKAKLIESKIYEKLTNIKKDFTHKVALNLVNKYDLIVFEDLSISKMRQTDMKNIRKGIADVAWNRFVQFTSYKAEWAGKKVILVDPKNTSKICSKCGNIIEKDLSTRIHECSCGLIIDRDLNAAINILRRGLSSLAKA